MIWNENGDPIALNNEWNNFSGAPCVKLNNNTQNPVNIKAIMETGRVVDIMVPVDEMYLVKGSNGKIKCTNGADIVGTACSSPTDEE